MFTAVALFLVGRASCRSARTNFSYLAIAAFLFLLESRRGLWTVPVLALLWVNLHGIEYPVLLLILGAYLGEWSSRGSAWLPTVTRAAARAASRRSARRSSRRSRRRTVSRCCSAPFTSLAFASQYVDELKPVDLGHLLALGLDGLYLVTRRTLLALVLVAGALGGAGEPRARALPARAPSRSSRAALFLLARIDRFNAGVRAARGAAARRRSGRASRSLPEPAAGAARRALGLALAALPVRAPARGGRLALRVPALSGRDLPLGSVEFLRQANATGAILNHPNDGGYLEWARLPAPADLRRPADALPVPGP